MGHHATECLIANLVEEMAARMNLPAEGLGAMILKDDIDLRLTLRDKN